MSSLRAPDWPASLPRLSCVNGAPACWCLSVAKLAVKRLPPQPALRAMALQSAHIYPGFVETLERSAGIEVDFRRQGTLVLGEKSPPANYRRLSPEQLQSIEAGVQVQGLPAFLVEEDSVDPVLLMRAAIRAAELAGIEIRTKITVQQMHWTGN